MTEDMNYNQGDPYSSSMAQEYQTNAPIGSAPLPDMPVHRPAPKVAMKKIKK